jgi:hypothetical protein
VERDALKSLELDKIGSLLGGNVSSELRRMELERASWMATMAQSHRLAEKIKKLVADTSLAAQMSKQAKELQAYSVAEQIKLLILEDSLAVQMAKRWHEVQRTEQETIRIRLEPLQVIRSSLLKDIYQEHRTGWVLRKYFQRVTANFEKPGKEEATTP